MPRPIDPEFLKIRIAQLRIALPEIDEDEILRLDMISGETDLDVVVGGLLDLRQESIEMRDGLDERMARIKIRYERAALRLEKIAETLRQILQAADTRKLVTPEATISIVRNPDSVNVTDVEALPQGYFRTTKTADKRAIAASLKNGETIPGAELTPGSDGVRFHTK